MAEWKLGVAGLAISLIYLGLGTCEFDILIKWIEDNKCHNLVHSLLSQAVGAFRGNKAKTMFDSDTIL